jgi:hypothetical protein
MLQKDFFNSIEVFYKTGVEIIKKKNQDYATEIDPFKNFRFAQMVGITPERACLVRISDKLARISNLLEKPESCTDEKIKDTLTDLANYVAILSVMLDEKN